MVKALLCFKNLEECPFHSIDEKYNTVFVLMPFEEQFSEVYLKGIKDGLPTGWECNRSDERWDIPETVCRICKSIQEATLIIADITGRNPNVFLELGLAFGLEKKFILITQRISDLPFDIKTFNTIEYSPDNLDDLHRKLREAISQLKPIPRLSTEAFVFDEELKEIREILEYQAPHPEQSGPAMQIIIGSKNNERDWLLPSEENERLLRCAPRFLFKEVKSRHDYHDFEPREKSFLRILRNGFIISKFPCVQWDSEKKITERTIYIHELVRYVAELFLFGCRIMKKKEIRDSQRMRIELLNVKGHLVRFDQNFLRAQEDYDFAESFITLEEDFNPDNSWESLLGILARIYRVICEHAAITNITDKTIKANLREIVEQIDELRTTYSDSGVCALDLSDIFKGFRDNAH
jgi:hypothetical protein